jgi:hypothetical protein
VKYIIFVIDEPGNLGNDSEMAEIKKFNESLRSNGNWVTAAGIAGSSEAVLIDNRDNRDSINPGSLVMSGENYSGFWVIEAENQSQAETLAKSGSKACNRKVELRPFLR